MLRSQTFLDVGSLSAAFNDSVVLVLEGYKFPLHVSCFLVVVFCDNFAVKYISESLGWLQFDVRMFIGVSVHKPPAQPRA